jgi:hypothetical protein
MLVGGKAGEGKSLACLGGREGWRRLMPEVRERSVKQVD